MSEWRFLGLRRQTDAALWHVNLWVCVAHFATALFIIIDQSDVKIPVTTSFVAWKQKNETTGDGCRDGNCYMEVEHATLKLLPDISLAWLIMESHFLSFTWQFVVLFKGPAQRYYHAQRAQGRNPLRWIEYALSAPLMIVVIAAILGQPDVAVLAMLAVSTSALMAFGYLTEVHYRMKPVSVPHVCGWILFSLMWSVVTFTFAIGLNRSATPPPGSVLAVIYSTYFIMLAFFGSFGVLQAVHLATDMKEPNVNHVLKEKDRHLEDMYTAMKYNAVEMWYAILSLSSKIALSILLYFLVRARHRLLKIEFI